MTIQIRSACPSDSQAAAPLICATAEPLIDGLFGFGDHRRAISAVAALFIHPGHRFSHAFTHLAEIDGSVAGLLLAYPARRELALSLALGPLVLREYGFADTLRLAWNGMRLAAGKENELDEFYIAHLATVPDFQRRGVGTGLLTHAEQLAQAVGIGKCSLIVDLDNGNAQQLYQKQGYQPVDTVRTPGLTQRYHTRGYYRMVKALPAGERNG